MGTNSRDFAKEIFLFFWEILVVGAYPGKCLDHKKKYLKVVEVN